MTTTITGPLKDQRTFAEKLEDALVSAFRRMTPKERVRLLRAARAATAALQQGDSSGRL